MSDNPLRKYFRQPAIYLELPSKGEFYSEDVLQLPESGEAPILPMTAMDEIAYKTPDALFNGTATADVVGSCVPAFKDPWQMLTIDLNTVLIAIRIASVGDEMEITSTCPECENTTDYTVSLSQVIDRKPDINEYKKDLVMGDLTITFKPMTYKEANDNNMVRFEEDRLARLIAEDGLSEEEKIQMLSESFKNISDFSIKAIQRSVQSIRTPDSVTTEREHINEFLQNCEKDIYDAVKDKVISLRQLEELDPFRIKCSECEHEYNQPYTMDMTTFFDKDS